MRGTRYKAPQTLVSERIIPAGAGDTDPCSLGLARTPDHPRGCGGHSAAALRRGMSSGSSPRVRGTRDGAGRHHPCARIIPAGAGDTTSDAPLLSEASDHPRGCGGHAKSALHVGAKRGSSPRVRGTLYPQRSGQSRWRIIPAGAGDTIHSLQQRGSPTDHPRGCGGHAVEHVAGVANCGSSPRVRGTRDGSLRVGGERRIIPAGAGDTISGASSLSVAADHPRGCGGHSSNTQLNLHCFFRVGQATAKKAPARAGRRWWPSSCSR